MTFRIRKYRELYVAERETQLPRAQLGIRGELRVVKQNAMGQVNYDSGWFPNLITDSGLDSLAYNDWRGYMRLGSGTTPPAFSDIALANQLPNGASYGTGTISTSGNDGAPNYEAWRIRYYYFPAGYATGTTNEIGLSSGTSSNLVVRSLVPSPVTKAADEVMTVYHKVFVSFDLADKTGSIIIQGSAGGESYDYILRPMNIDHPSGMNIDNSWAELSQLTSYHYVHAGDGDIGATVTDSPTGTTDTCQQTTTGIWESIDFVTHTAINRVYYGLDKGNFPGLGIRSFRLSHRMRPSGATPYGWQLRVGRTSDDATIMKDDTQDLNVALELAWNRV